MFSFVRNCQTVFQSDCTTPAMNGSSCCSAPSSAFGVVRLWDFSHSHRWVVVSVCCCCCCCFNIYLSIYLAALGLSCSTRDLFFFKLFLGLFIYLIYLFMAVLGLRFCARAFSSCGKWGPLFIVVCGPLIIAASLVAEHRLSNCGSRA